MMDSNEVLKIYREALRHVKVSCNEHHVHRASRGCLQGEKCHVDICKLYEYIEKLHGRIHRAKRVLDGRDK
jgi:SET domain-containing protein